MTSIDRNARIGFVGLGIMGQSMAGHLQKAGYRLNVHNRTRAKADGLIEGGATWQDSPGDVAAASDVVITMVGYPADVEEVYLGDGGIIERAPAGTYLVDMTTSEPSLAARIYDAAKAKGLHSLDAPVSGGDVGAREARLSIMVGGDGKAFEALQPIFGLMGANIQLQGGAGAGQHTKMCNQIVIAGNMVGTAEALIYAKRSGLDPKHVLDSIATGAAGSFLLSNLGPKMIAGDFDPGFFIHHFIKDMTIALAEAEGMKLPLPGVETARMMYQKVVEMGGREDGTQALFKAYDE